MTTITIEFVGNAQDAQALVHIAQVAGSVGAKVTFGEGIIGASAHVPQEPKAPKARKPLGEAKEVRIEVTTVGRSKSLFGLGYGAGRAGAKLYLKSFGLKWDAEKRGYTGTKAQVAEFRAVLVEDEGKTYLPVSAEWVAKGRDKAAAKKARKGA